MSKTLNQEQPSPFSKGPFLKASFLQALKVFWAFTWRATLFTLLGLVLGMALASALSYLVPPFNAIFSEKGTFSIFNPLMWCLLAGMGICALFFLTKIVFKMVNKIRFKDFRVVYVYKENRTLNSASWVFVFY